MKKLTPEKFLTHSKWLLTEFKKSKNTIVKVGIQEESRSRDIYENGDNAVEIGAMHEFGAGVPQRSFLRTPFEAEKQKLARIIDGQYKAVCDSKINTATAMERIGVVAQDISQTAFENNGYGTWQPLSEATILKKKSSKPLIDTGTLKNSITYKVVK